MATIAMSTIAPQITVHEGNPFLRVPCRVNGASELAPGMTATQVDHTWPDVGRPDAKLDHIVGIVDCELNHDVDELYADNADIHVWMCGSGAVARGWKKGGNGGGTVYFGEILASDGAGDKGHVRPLSKALAGHATYGSWALTIVGRAHQYLASSADVYPIEILLAI